MLNDFIFNIWFIFSLDRHFLAEAQPVGNTFTVQLLPIYLLWRDVFLIITLSRVLKPKQFKDLISNKILDRILLQAEINGGAGCAGGVLLINV